MALSSRFTREYRSFGFLGRPASSHHGWGREFAFSRFCPFLTGLWSYLMCSIFWISCKCHSRSLDSNFSWILFLSLPIAFLTNIRVRFVTVSNLFIRLLWLFITTINFSSSWCQNSRSWMFPWMSITLIIYIRIWIAIVSDSGDGVCEMFIVEVNLYSSFSGTYWFWIFQRL
jgi:hypothetical protein